MKGSCLCGSIQYDIKGFSPGIANCHCSMCRKASGSAYGVFGTVPLEDITWVKGGELIKEFTSSPEAKRGFCPNCGSSLYFKLLGDNTPFEIALGTLDEEPNHPVDANIFFASKPGWSISYDLLPSFDTVKTE